MATVNGEIDKINARELYDGKENPLNIDFEKRIKFTCSFDNIQNYPFGMQVNETSQFYFYSNAKCRFLLILRKFCHDDSESHRTVACITTSLGLTTSSHSSTQWSWWIKVRRSLASISSTSGK